MVCHRLTVTQKVYVCSLFLFQTFTDQFTEFFILCHQYFITQLQHFIKSSYFINFNIKYTCFFLFIDIKMNRSISQSQLQTKSLKRQISNKSLYVNEQVKKKTDKNSMQTIFHSPFKNGRRNVDYANPTFMSSDIIYNISSNQLSELTPKKAIIHTEAQNRQRALYHQRMNRSQSFTNLTQRIKSNSKINKSRKVTQQQKCVNSIKLVACSSIGMSTKLAFELQNLMKYKKSRELREMNGQSNTKQRFFRKIQQKKSKQLPTYFQKVYTNENYQQEQQQKKKQELRKWQGIDKELGYIKAEIKREKRRTQQQNMKRNVDSFNVDCYQQDLNRKRNQQLLNRILTEQIRTKQREQLSSRRQKGWKRF